MNSDHPKADISTNSPPPSFAVVIFTKNESITTGILIDKITRLYDRNNIFVVDGHSTDSTAAVVKEKNVHFLLDNGQGKGAAIRFAIGEIHRDILVFIDSDGSHQPSEISSLLAPFYSDQSVAMVVGSRFKGGSEELSRSPQELLRKAGNLLSNFIINTRWGANLSDTQNGFRAIRRKEILKLQLQEDTFAIEQELTMKCLKKKMKIIEVPSFELSRAHGTSHVIITKMLPVYTTCLLRNVFSRDTNP